MAKHVTGSSPRLIFRYTGVFDWKRLYRDSREFWLRIIQNEWDMIEPKFQHKGSKIDVKWKMVHNYDAYYQIQYNVWFKIINPAPVFIEENGKKKEMMRGNLRIWTEYSWNEEYKSQTLAGDSKVFRAQWLKDIYRKVTWRDRWDLLDDVALFTCNDYMQLVGKICKADASGYASIWEPG